MEQMETKDETVDRNETRKCNNKFPMEVIKADDKNEPEIAANLADDTNSSDNHLLLEHNNTYETVRTVVEMNNKKKNQLSEFSYELQQAHKIVKDLMSDGHKGVNSPFMGPINELQAVKSLDDYNDVIERPVWLRSVKEKFFENAYKTITEVVADIRLMLENCYRYHGPNSVYTKKGVRLEQILEQKLALLPRDLRERTTFEATYGHPCSEEFVGTRRRSTRQSMDYTSFILNQVKHERGLRDKEQKKKQIEEKKVEKEEKEKEILDWENSTLLAEPIGSDMKAMWELPLIGHFLYLCQTVLNMPEVTIYELERILAMPRASTLLPKVMTSLLSNPQQRANLDRKPPMPYKVWQNRLQGRVQSWYKIHQARNNRADLVFQQLGIEADFFRIMGPENPLLEKKFHELTFHQRVWLVKSLCDYILQSHKTIQDTLNEKTMQDMREYVLGTDAKGNSYLHFPQFCGQDLRIYRCSKVTKHPGPIKWGAISTRKRQAENDEPTSPSTTKKPKLSDSLSFSPRSSPRSSPIRSSTASPSPSNTRRSLRLSNMKVESPTKEQSSSSDTEEQDEDEEDESGVEESEDDDIALEPNIDQFELIVDSVHSLRKLIDKLKLSRFGRKKKMTASEKKESELISRLNNLLIELEPWETKLEKATRRSRQKLRKEWDEFVEKEEEVEEDIWGSDRESEPKKLPSNESSRLDDSSASSSEDEFFAPESNQSSTSAQGLEKLQLELVSFGDNEFGEFRTRGQLRQLQSLKLNSSDLRNTIRSMKTPNSKIKLNGAQIQNENSVHRQSQQNCSTKGNELYAWETLQQILVPNSSSVTSTPNAMSPKSGGSAFDSLGEILMTSPTKNISTPERKSMTKAEVDILGAIQAATSLAKSHEMAETKEESVSFNFDNVLPSVAEKAVINAEQTPHPYSKSNVVNLNLPPRFTVFNNRSSGSASLTTAPQVSASPRQTSVLNKPSAKSSCIPTKQQLSELSSIADNTENLRGLLQQANQTARSKNNFVKAGGNLVTARKQQSSNTTLLSVKNQDGKLIYYQLTPRPNVANQTANNLESLVAKPAGVMSSKATTTRKPDSAVPQPAQQVTLLPIKGGNDVQYVTISPNNLVTKENRGTNLSATKQSNTTASVPDESPAKMQLHSVVSSSLPQNFPAPVTDQKMILVPVSNHQGQTVYLQLPNSSSPSKEPGIPNVSMVTQMASSSASPLPPTSVANSKMASLPGLRLASPEIPKPEESMQSQRTKTFALSSSSSSVVVPRNVCYRPFSSFQSKSHATASNLKIPLKTEAAGQVLSYIPLLNQTVNAQNQVVSSRIAAPLAIAQTKVNLAHTPIRTAVANAAAATRTLSSNNLSTIVTASSPVRQIVAPSSGVSAAQIATETAGPNASLNTLFANNPTLSATVQKLAMAGHKVVLSEQGGRLIIRATHNASVSSPVTRSAQTKVFSTAPNVPVANPQIIARPPLFTEAPRPMATALSPLRKRSEASTLNLPAPMITTRPRVPHRTSVSTVPSSTLTMPQQQEELMAGPRNSPDGPQNELPNMPLVNAEPNSLTLTGKAESSAPATVSTSPSTAAPTSIKSKLVMIHDSDSNKQILGLLLDNGQVLPLNATVSVSNSSPATVETSNRVSL